ncbi:MAG: branched-chain amino acid ABC transporter permease [Fimbriimonadaceae bacterium]|nr:branched-chain amino acid ABC transporter permease [Fimbriimonadaceae bacterium]
MRYWIVRLGSIAAAVLFAFIIERLAGGFDAFGQRLVVLAGLYVTLAVSLNLINGITGQFSIGHAAFYQVGAYTTGYMAMRFYDASPIKGEAWLICMMFVGALFASVAGFVVGLPSLRLRGDYLAIVTLGFGEILRIVVQNIETLGGAYGMNVTPKFQYIWLVWLLAFVTIAVSRNLLQAAHGLPFLAVREDEVASSAMGVNVTKTKLVAFLLGSAFAGAAGALLAHFEGFISPQMFDMNVSFIILTMVVLGGTGSITGSVLAAISLYYLPEKLRDLPPVSAASLIAGVLAVGLCVAFLKNVEMRYHGPKVKRAAIMVGGIIGAIVVQGVLARMLGNVSALADQSYEASKLRMVIFAGTLIILMLLRPQGVLAHYEFSWDGVKRMLGMKRKVATA